MLIYFVNFLFFTKILHGIDWSKDMKFQLVYKNAVVSLIKTSSVIQSISALSQPSKRKLNDIKTLNIVPVSTTVTFVLQSFLGLSGVQEALGGLKMTRMLVDSGYNVKAEDPVLTNMSPITAAPVESLQSNTSTISAIVLGIAAFIAVIIIIVYYFRGKTKV